MTHALVDKDALDRLIRKAWDMFTLLADESGYEQVYLEPESELVTLAVQAGLLIPGPLSPGSVPPVPPARRFRGGTPLAGVYRADGDPRIRCSEDAKVVYWTRESAQSAARLISARKPMYAYLGPCGHYHVSRKHKE